MVYVAHPKDIWLLSAADLVIDMFIAEIDRKALCMQESQSIEWKWTWQDEYLKWLCGYANTDGGTLYIGVNDDGYVVGVKDSKVLLESLPNKIQFGLCRMVL